jgi:shikimate kinase
MKKQSPAVRPIFLCGFMGVGKTTVGKRLAELRTCRFVDLDRAIEAEAGCAIPAIFANEGEAGFRRRESTALRSLALADTVVALGGGALTKSENFEFIASAGILIYLSASVETLMDRLSDATEFRPLLAGLSLAERRAKILQLMGEREAVYRKAQLEISTDGLSADAVAAKANALITERAS